MIIPAYLLLEVNKQGLLQEKASREGLTVDRLISEKENKKIKLIDS